MSTFKSESLFSKWIFIKSRGIVKEAQFRIWCGQLLVQCTLHNAHIVQLNVQSTKLLSIMYSMYTEAHWGILKTIVSETESQYKILRLSKDCSLYYKARLGTYDQDNLQCIFLCYFVLCYSAIQCVHLTLYMKGDWKSRSN